MKERLNRILRSVIESYIENGEPVSSKGILEREPDMNVSSATVRNDLSELERMVDHVKETQQKDAVAFSMYPTSMAELFAVADAGMLMPPKSTWFEPKLRSGIFVHKLRG
mgnify:CR=1 FL=1